MITDCKSDFDLFKEIVFDEKITTNITNPLWYECQKKMIFCLSMDLF
jgi:hypothetical protein